MADIADPHDPNAPGSENENGNGVDAASRGVKRARAAADDDDDDDDKPGRERRKIEIKFIQDKSRRHITFSKRKAGIMKKVSSRSVCSQRMSSQDALYCIARRCLRMRKLIVALH